MNFDSIDTADVYLTEGEFGQLDNLLGKSSTVTAETLFIQTEAGETLKVHSDAGYDSITIERVADDE